MMATHYSLFMPTKRKASGRQAFTPMTDEQRAKAKQVVERVHQLEVELPQALDDRDDYFRELHDLGIFPTQIAAVLLDETGVAFDRTHISKMITSRKRRTG